MAIQIVLPKLGFAMEEGVLAEWLVAQGAQVTEGQPIYVLESDKSAQEIESPGSGVLHIVALKGETYQVGHVLGEIR